MKTIVMCEGDSRTWVGSGWGYYPLIGSYPYYLQQLLGNDYDVRQWGEGGTAVSVNHYRSIWNFMETGKRTLIFQKGLNVQQFNSAFERGFPAEDDLDDAKWIVIANYGTIDAGAKSWSTVKSKFVASYKSYFGQKKGEFYICLPQPTFNKGENSNWSEIPNANIIEQQPMIKQIAQDLGIKTVDLNTGITSNLSGDGIHFGEEANKIFAERVYKAMTGNVIPPQPPTPPVNNNAQYVKEIKILLDKIK